MPPAAPPPAAGGAAGSGEAARAVGSWGAAGHPVLTLVILVVLIVILLPFLVAAVTCRQGAAVAPLRAWRAPPPRRRCTHCVSGGASTHTPASWLPAAGAQHGGVVCSTSQLRGAARRGHGSSAAQGAPAGQLRDLI